MRVPIVVYLCVSLDEKNRASFAEARAQRAEEEAARERVSRATAEESLETCRADLEVLTWAERGSGRGGQHEENLGTSKQCARNRVTPSLVCSRSFPPLPSLSPTPRALSFSLVVLAWKAFFSPEKCEIVPLSYSIQQHFLPRYSGPCKTRRS